MASTITPEEHEESQRLYAELPVAKARAAAALRTEPPSHRFEGAAQARFAEEEPKFAAIVRRIKES